MNSLGSDGQLPDCPAAGALQRGTVPGRTDRPALPPGPNIARRYTVQLVLSSKGIVLFCFFIFCLLYPVLVDFADFVYIVLVKNSRFESKS